VTQPAHFRWPHPRLSRLSMLFGLCTSSDSSSQHFLNLQYLSARTSLTIFLEPLQPDIELHYSNASHFNLYRNPTATAPTLDRTQHERPSFPPFATPSPRLLPQVSYQLPIRHKHALRSDMHLDTASSLGTSRAPPTSHPSHAHALSPAWFITCKTGHFG
jgi:hypothetical protein